MKNWIQKSMSIGSLLLIVSLFVTSTADAQTNYYYKGTGALNTQANWGLNPDGSGTAPANFTANNQVFNVRNTSAVSTTAAWTVSGTSSKIVIGDGTNATNLTVATAGTITGTVDVAAAATLTLTNTTIPTLGTLNAASTVVYNATGTQSISAVTYGNLTYSGSSTGTFGGGCTISGNFLCSAGSVTFNSTTTDRTWTIGGSFTMSSTGTIEFGSGTGHSVMNLSGNFSKTNGAMTTTGNTENGLFNMVGLNSTMQSTATGTALKWTDFTIPNGSTCTLNGDFTETGSAGTTATITVSSGGTLITGTANIIGANSTFVLSSGATLQIGSTAGITTAGTATGNIQTATRTFNVGANYIYNGTTAQATGTGFPTNLTGSLTINNTGNTITLSAARTIASGGTVNLTNGVLGASTNLTMASTSTINRSGGTITGSLQGAGVYNLNYTGNSKTTGPELTGTGLNNISENLTTGQTLTLGAALNTDGSVTIATGTTLDVSASNFALNISGSWTNNGTFTGGTSTVTFNGAAQAIGGSTALSFYSLVLSGSGNKTLAGAVTVTTTFAISGTAVALLPSGSTSSANTLSLGGVGVGSGSWGGTTSAATSKSATYFGSSTTGIINITTSSCTAGNWTGVTSTDWFTASNWCSGVPTSTTDIVIPSTAPNQPNINAAGAVCRNIIINSGATLTMTGSNALSISGNWTNNGSFTGATSTLAFTGVAAQIIAGTAATTFGNVTINKTAAANTVTSNTTAFTVSVNLTVTQGNLVLTATDNNYTVNGNVSVAANGTLTHNVDWDVAGKQLTVGGNIDINGAYTHTPSRTHVQMTGTSKTLNTGTSSLSIVTLAGATVTASGPVTILDNFWAPFGTSGSFSTGGQTCIASGALLISAGTVNVNGGSLTVSGGTLIGNGTNSGTLNISSSGAFVTDALTLGDAASTSASTITQSSGTVTVNGAVTINQPTANFTNAWNINGQAATVSGAISFAGTAVQTNRIENIVLTTGTLNANGGITFAGTIASTKVINLGTTGTLNFKGNLSGANVATLTAGTSGSTFNYNDATSAQTVGIFGAGAYNNLHINTTGGAGATLGAAITATSVTGNLRVQSGTFSNGGFAIAGNAARTFEVANLANFYLAGTTSAFPTGFGTVSLGTTSTVDYRGSGAQTISAQNYGNLTTTVNGTRTITLANAGTIGIAGVFSPAITNTTYTNTGSTVSFNSTTGSQNIPAFTFNVLNINNTSGVVLTGNATVNGGAGALSFTNGKITTGSNAVVLGSTTTSTTASAGKYIFGNQTYNVPTGTPSGTFYIGDATNYTPVTISFTTAITTGGTLTVNTTAGDHPNISSPVSNFITTKTVNRFWTLTSSGILPATPGYSATFNFIGPTPGSGDIDAAATPANFVVKRYNGSWNSTNVGTRTGTSTQATAINGYGDFQIGEICSAPVINTPAVTNISCNGSTNGAIDITTTGGTTPFTYAWTSSNGFTAATEDITGLATGTYTLTITTPSGCLVSSGSINITQPAVLSATVTPTNISCNGAGDGSIAITSPTGGYGTYEYTINGGTNWQSSGNFTGLAVGTYNVKIRDAAHTACIVTLNGSLSITQPPVLSATVNSSNVTCNGGTDGSITITSPAGGYGTYEFTINGGTNWQSSGSFTGLTATSFNVRIRDAAHTTCVVTLNGSLTLTEPAGLNATVTPTNISCNGGNDGAITITSPTGGFGTYQYSINGGTSWQSSGSFTGLSASTYDVRIRDAAHTSCVVILDPSLALTQLAALSATVTPTNVDCNGASNGEINITSPTGGSGSYEYTINGGTNWQANGDFTGLATSAYNVQIRDANHTSCVVTLNGSLTLTQPTALSATVGSTNVDCNGSSNGSVSITSPAGGSGSFEFTINGGTNWQSSGSFTGLAATTYDVRIRDANHTSCVVTLNGSLTITEPAALNANNIGTNASCGNNDGQINITSPTGGSGSYEYTINGGTNWQASGSFTGLAAGTYDVRIRDANHPSCVVILDASQVINQNSAPDAPISGGNQTVCYNGDPEQTITASATSPVTITWYTAASGGTIVSPPSLTGIGTVTYYAEAGSGSCVSPTRTAVTLTIQDAPVPPTSGGDQTVCYNGNPTQTLIATATSPATITWYDAATGGNIVSPPALIGLGTVTYFAEASNGTCTSPERTPVTLTINPVLATPGTISGPLDVCPLIGSVTPSVYSIAPVSGATFYTWVVPVGTTIVSGQGTTSLSVTFDNSFALTNSMFIVTAESPSACTSAPSSIEVLKVIPAIPTAINGPTDVCSYIGQPTNAVYTIDPVPNATSYTWQVLGSNISLVSGQGSTSIQVSYATGFTSGNIKVTANSNCGNRAPRSLGVTRFTPTAPTAINGPADACSFIGTATQVNYTIDPVVNATSYTWTVPNNVTLVSGQGTTSIMVTFNTGYTTSQIKVKSISNCGTSGDRALSVVAATTSTPGTINGPNNACIYIGTANNATYSIAPVANATSYIWNVPAGANIVSHPAGTGVNDTIITVSFNNSFVSGTNITVQAVACLASPARSLSVSRIVPSTPGTMTGATNACPFMISGTNPTGTPVQYTIRKVTNATTYIWSAPAGANITAHPAGAGVNDTIVEITYSAGFVSGSVSVSASSDCGTSTARTLAITKLTPGTPGAITTVNTSPCPSRQYTYSLASMPSNTNSILWTVPPQGTIQSGQGTTSITVSYTSGAVTGTVTATGYNNCANSSTRSINISLPACSGGKATSGRTGIITSTSTNATEGITVNMYPNPTVNDFRLQVVSSANEKIVVRILDMQGRELKQLSVTANQTINIGADLKAGSYMVEVSQGDKRTTQKLMKF